MSAQQNVSFAIIRTCSACNEN